MIFYRKKKVISRYVKYLIMKDISKAWKNYYFFITNILTELWDGRNVATVSD